MAKTVSKSEQQKDAEAEVEGFQEIWPVRRRR